MRQQKTFLLLGVVLGTLMLSVAYASLQNITLEINGIATATPDQANFDVKLNYIGYFGFGNLSESCYHVGTITDTSVSFSVTRF